MSRREREREREREGRDSDSKRHRSCADREPSPKWSRRSGKPEPERMPVSSKSDNRNKTDEFPLESTLPADSKQETGPRSKEPEREHKGTKHVEGVRPRSRFQHDERDVGRSFGRGATGERGWWRDSTDQHNAKTGNKNATNVPWRRDIRVKGDEKGNWRRHDSFVKTEADDSRPARKRPAFRENKIQADDSGRSEKSSAAISKEERGNEERGRKGRQMDRPEKTFEEDQREPPKAGFSGRERYHRDDGNYRRGDRFSGRPGFHSSRTRVEKWKHDLYLESDKIPTPKNEEDQIAKVEALLSS